jgi:hypothetical protein
MLAEIFLLVIVFYLLYRFVFNFLLPVVKTTRHVREQFRNMQDTAAGQPRPGSSFDPREDQSQQSQPKSWQDRHTTTKGAADDYIDFEEIKTKKESLR